MQHKKIGFFTACALVVANMVGTGVFSSLGFQVAALPSVSVLLLLWLCGGIVALCGGLSYIELARLYPGSGGEYHYIRSAYPKVLSFFSGGVSIFAGFAAPVALAAITFSKYFGQFYTGIPGKWLSIILISIVTAFHCFSLKLGSGFQLATTVIKVIILLMFIGAGLFSSELANPLDLGIAQFDLVASKGFAVSLVYVSFAYSGWNACVYIFSEIKNPEKNISRSILIGTAVVTILYVLLNFVFLKTVPIKSLDGVIEVGAVSAKAIFGPSGGKWMAIIISLLLVSTISAMVWVGPRVIDRMFWWKDGQESTKKVEVPLKAMFLQYVVTMALLITDTFEGILISAGVLLCLSSCLCVAILFFNKRQISFQRMIAPTFFLIANIYTMVVLLT
ncbi:APC family permease [Pedobacter lithocola]|uniref:APC family permease n=1 Tax=Pedobacter lithocola TaxID=1908239 RepID=A0ABV8PH47_9SPHI